MAKTVNQPTAAPTNKLTAAMTAAGVMGLAYWGLELFWPALPNEALVTGLTPIAVVVAGWFVKDKPNT